MALYNKVINASCNKAIGKGKYNINCKIGSKSYTATGTGGSVTFATYLTVDIVLTLTNGFITTGVNYLIIQSHASTAIAAGTGNSTFTNSWVNGNLTRFYTSG